MMCVSFIVVLSNTYAPFRPLTIPYPLITTPYYETHP